MIPPEFYDANLEFLTIHRNLCESILRDIVRRLEKTDFTLTQTAEWQTEKLHEAGMLYEDILSEIAKRTGRQKGEIEAIYQKAELAVLDRTESLTTDSGTVNNLSPAIKKSFSASLKRTAKEVKNLTGTTAVTSRTLYITAADEAHMQVVSGAFSYSEAIRYAVKRAAQSDLTVLYPSGHVSSLAAAVRRAVLTGINQTAGELSDRVGKELGYDLREITAHMGARPEHAVWQGKIVSMSGRKGYLSTADIGYGDVRGFMGANCRHNWYPYPEGAPRSYSDEELDKMAHTTVTYNGEEIPIYEATQKQRRMERAVRQSKSELVALDELLKSKDEKIAGEAKNDFVASSVKLKAREERLSDFCKQTELSRDRYREQVFATKTENGIKNFGQSTSAKAVWAKRKSEQALDNAAQSGIINSENDIQIGNSLGAAAFRDVVSLPNGNKGKIQEGSKITKVVTFAGKGTDKDLRVATHLEKQYDVPKAEWKHSRGDGYVVCDDGKTRHAELHWFESDKTGRIKMKVKRYFDDES